MLMPKKVKHRKQQRGRMKGNAKGATEVSYGQYGIQAKHAEAVTGEIDGKKYDEARHYATLVVTLGK